MNVTYTQYDCLKTAVVTLMMIFSLGKNYFFLDLLFSTNLKQTTVNNVWIHSRIEYLVFTLLPQLILLTYISWFPHRIKKIHGKDTNTIMEICETAQSRKDCTQKVCSQYICAGIYIIGLK